MKAMELVIASVSAHTLHSGLTHVHCHNFTILDCNYDTRYNINFLVHTMLLLAMKMKLSRLAA